MSSWYSSGVFVLIVIVLTSIFIVGVKSVSPLIITLFSFVITLLILYNSGDYNGLLVVLNIKPGACGFDDYDIGVYGLLV